MTPLTSRAIADIVRLHLDGRAPAHLCPRCGHSTQNQTPELASTVVLDPGDYEHGTRARRNAHDLLGNVDSHLADAENRADKLLEDLLEFLGSEAAGVLTDVVE